MKYKLNMVLSKKMGSVLLLLILGGIIASAQNSTAAQRLWLLGNTADIKADSDFFDHFRKALEDQNDPVHVLVNGDLIKNCGPDRVPPKIPVEKLLKTVEGLGHVEMTILPGDRDWNNSGKGGLQCVESLRKLVNSYDLENVHWPIEKGCPGPVVTDINPSLVLININTQWWNHPHRKPIPADADCKVVAIYDVLEELEDAIEENKDRNILVAGHFPPFSMGRYGGRFPLKDHFLPPVIGSIKVAYRQHVGTQKDIVNPNFREIAGTLLTLAKEYTGLIFLSSHEPNQQILFNDGNYLINSGAPEKTGYAVNTRLASLSEAKAGFIEMSYFDDQRVTYQFHQHTNDGFKLADQGILFQSPCQEELVLGLPVNDAKAPCWTEDEDADKPLTSKELGVRTVIPGSQYEAGGLKKTFFGEHYRSSWTTPIQVPVLNLDTVEGGLTILERGGGRQTKSLKLQATDGEQWVFRSVDKDPIGALDYQLRNTIIAAVTRDQTSTEHPYGAIVVAALLKELDVLHATPSLYVLPDVKRLRQFQAEFGGMLGMLEQRPSNPDDDEPPFGSADRVYKSYKLFQKMYEEKDIWLDKEEFARARIFDILIGDWSKHEDNWKWAGYKEGDQLMVRPIPRDRDHAFSKIDGLLPWLADREWAVPNLETFENEIKSIRSLTFQARHMDRFLANEITQEEWLEAARFIQSRLTEEVIDRCVGEMPLEVYTVSGPEIAIKLKQRRLDLEQYARRFYRLLAREVDVVGTNEEERFEVNRNEDGSTDVKVFNKEDDALIYERRFFPEETTEIRLFGLHNEDDFIIEGEANEAIKLRIIGGPGKDDVRDKSQISKGGKRTLVYEKSDRAEIKLGEEGKRVHSWNDDLYHYNRTAFAYNRYLPLAYISFNTFNGITFKGGVTFTRHNYNKKDYSAKHGIGIEVSSIGNFGLQYEGKYHHVIKKWDVITSAEFARPANFNFFFGLGNETEIDEDLFDQDFYLIKQNVIRVKTGLSRDFWDKSSFNLVFGYENSDVPTKANNILEPESGLFGIEQLNIFNAVAQLEIDLRDHEVFPTKGLRFMVSQEAGITSNKDFGITDAFLEYYLSPAYYPLTLGVKVGYSTTFGDVPFFKLPQLGQNNSLRGFQRNRFTGDSRLYFNTEIGIPIAKVNTPILPFRIGLRGFYDIGQVEQKDIEEADDWNTAYGGGIYLIPLTRSYTFSILVGRSEEESAVVSLQLGTNF